MKGLKGHLMRARGDVESVAYANEAHANAVAQVTFAIAAQLLDCH